MKYIRKMFAMFFWIITDLKHCEGRWWCVFDFSSMEVVYAVLRAVPLVVTVLLYRLLPLHYIVLKIWDGLWRGHVAIWMSYLFAAVHDVGWSRLSCLWNVWFTMASIQHGNRFYAGFSTMFAVWCRRGGIRVRRHSWHYVPHSSRASGGEKRSFPTVD